MPNRYELSTTVQKRLRELGLTAEVVIRKALDIKNEGLYTEGVFFAEGTDFLAWYKDRPHWGRIKEGMIEIHGKPYPSVSAAAASITGRATTNGWEFWLVKDANKTAFVPISSLRTK